ncbi:hypothetical protein GCM10010975_24880 [Comamonas phosphati]|nr:hypothetical protein GCM10010975_24880 [Comamonas phosphati]
MFEKQNIAFMVSLAFAVAASANFPPLLLSVLWKDCTTKGAVIGGFLGLISSVGLTVVSPPVWEATLGHPKGSAWFPYTSPALFSMAIGFAGVWLFSVLDRSGQAAKEREALPAQQVRSEPAWVHRAHRGTDALRSDAAPARIAQSPNQTMRLSGMRTTPPHRHTSTHHRRRG